MQQYVVPLWIVKKACEIHVAKRKSQNLEGKSRGGLAIDSSCSRLSLALLTSQNGTASSLQEIQNDNCNSAFCFQVTPVTSSKVTSHPLATQSTAPCLKIFVLNIAIKLEMTNKSPFKAVCRLNNADKIETNIWNVVEVICVIKVS